jgi:hypothetical protein
MRRLPWRKPQLSSKTLVVSPTMATRASQPALLAAAAAAAAAAASAA